MNSNAVLSFLLVAQKLSNEIFKIVYASSYHVIPIDAMQVLSLSELSSVSMRLADIQMLSLGKGTGIHQMLRLNIGKDDLNYGLSL